LTLWDGSELHAFDHVGFTQLQAIALRALIKPDEVHRANNVLFFSNVLAAAPPDVIRSEKKRCLDTILQCCAFMPIEVMLGPIYTVLACDSDFELFVSMSQISLPRMLTLAVNDVPETRAKATAILRLVARVNTDAMIIAGLVQAFGLQVVASLANFFVIWIGRGEPTRHGIALLGALFDALTADAKHVQEFAFKAIPVLAKFVRTATGRVQVSAVELSARVLAITPN
jgi:hypothetical protein